MKDKIKYYKCPVCGNVIEVVSGDISHIKCCNQEMELLVANTIDASLEKHVPIYEKDGDDILVKVGDIIHPMEDKHYIMWISLVTDDKVIRVDLNPGDDPVVRFPYIGGAIIYEYCNLHGLWKNIVK